MMGTTTLNEEAMRVRRGRRRFNHREVHQEPKQHDGTRHTLEKLGNVVGGENSLGNGS